MASGWTGQAWVLAVAGLAACQGQIGEPSMGGPQGSPTGTGGSSTTGGPGGTSSTTGSPTGGPAVQCTSTAPTPGRSPLRRLNRPEYRSTVADLLGVNTAVAATFPPDNAGLGFTNNADVLSVTNLLPEAYMTASESLATAAVANLTTLLPCATAGHPAGAKHLLSHLRL